MSQYHLRPAEGAAFSAGRATKSDLVRGAQMFLGLNCFEPGQSQHTHVHRAADKFYLILSGKARMAVGDEVFEAATGDLIWAPADVPHGVTEAVERTVMLVGIAGGQGGT